MKAQVAGTIPGDEDMNFWGHSLALAAAILYHQGLVHEIIVMGGRTGGPAYKSEAELIRDRLVFYGVPSHVIRLEETSSNTLENIVNFADLYLGEDPDRSFDLLGTPYHIEERIPLLMTLFSIRWQETYAAHAVIREALSNGFAMHEIVRAVEEMSILDIPLERDPDDLTGFYGKQVGVERETYFVRAYKEDAFIRLLLEEPSYWMTYLARIKNDLLLSRVLRKVDWIFPSYLESLGIQAKSSDPAMLKHAREVLGPIPRLKIDRWIIDEMPKDWPATSRQMLRTLRWVGKADD